MHFRRVVVERPVCTTRAQLRVACFCFEDFGSTAEEDGEAPGSARKPPNNKRRQSQLLQNSFSLTYFQLKLPRPGEVRARPRRRRSPSALAYVAAFGTVLGHLCMLPVVHYASMRFWFG